VFLQRCSLLRLLTHAESRESAAAATRGHPTSPPPRCSKCILQRHACCWGHEQASCSTASPCIRRRHKRSLRKCLAPRRCRLRRPTPPAWGPRKQRFRLQHCCSSSRTEKVGRRAEFELVAALYDEVSASHSASFSCFLGEIRIHCSGPWALRIIGGSRGDFAWCECSAERIVAPRNHT
jgi:hypothetical protein